MTIETSLKHINSLWGHAPLKACLLTLTELPISEFITGLGHLSGGAIKAPLAVIKLPISFLALLSNNEALKELHTNLLPGLTDVLKSAFKAAICFFNIIWAPCLELLNIEENLKYHKMCGLIGYANSSKTKVIQKPQKNFCDIAGMESVKETLSTEVIRPVQDPTKAAEYGIQFPKGVLLYGPPGCGKTHFAECLAGELGYHFIRVSPGTIGSIYMYGSILNIKQSFEQAISLEPCVLFFDEFDALGETRSDSEHTVNKQKNAEIAELLNQIDKLNQEKRRVLIIAATNYHERLDSALIRDGRFNTQIEISLPDFECRTALFKQLIEKLNKTILDEKGFDYRQLAQLSTNFTCSSIQTIVGKAQGFAFKNSVQISQAIVIQEINKQKEQKKSDSQLAYFL